MSRYGIRAQLDPRVSVYHDDQMDFSRGSFGRHPRAIAIKEPPTEKVSQDSNALSASFSKNHPSLTEHEDRGSQPNVAPATESAPVTGSYVAWTGGVQYSNPEHAIVEPISNEELLEGLSRMRLDREKKRESDGMPGPRSPMGMGPKFGLDQRMGMSRDNGYGPRDNGYASRQDKGGNDGWDNPGAIKGGDDDSWGATGGGEGDNSWGGGGFSARPPRIGGNECFNCGQPGHRSAECTEERKPRAGGGGGGGGGCFKCGEEGHFSRECPNGPSAGGRACYNCGQPGHESRECDQERVAGAFRGECYNCGEQGHASRDCVKERKMGAFRGTCHNCGEQGHQSRDCQQPRNMCGRYGDTSNWSGGAPGPGGFLNSDNDWGQPQTPHTPGLTKAAEGNDGGWGNSPVDQIVQTPAPSGQEDGGWGPPPTKAQGQDDWGASPSPTPAARVHSQAPPPEQSPRAPAGIHPDRLRMMQGGGGGFAEHRQRDAPPHLGGGGGYQARPERSQVQPQARAPAPAPQPVNDEFDGW